MGKGNRAGVKECVAMMYLMKRLIILPPKPEVESQLWREFKVILHKEAVGPCPRRNKNVLHLDIAIVHGAKEKVGERVPSLGTKKIEASG